MKIISLLFLISIFIISCENKTENEAINSIFDSHYEHSLISKGDNFPDFNQYKDSLDLFLMSLYKGISTESFKNKVKWSDSVVNEKIDLLLDKIG